MLPLLMAPFSEAKEKRLFIKITASSYRFSMCGYGKPAHNRYIRYLEISKISSSTCPAGTAI